MQREMERVARGDRHKIASNLPCANGLANKALAKTANPTLWLALFELKGDQEAQITKDFDPVLSRKLDALNDILEV